MLFGELDPAIQRELRELGRERNYRDGEIVQQRGDEPTGFWLVEAGEVMVGQYLVDGTFRGVAVLGAGDSFGELAVFAGSPRAVDTVVRGPTRLRFIAARDFLDLLGRHPESGRALLGALSLQLQELISLFGGIRQRDSSLRLAAMLANLTSGSDGPTEIATSQQELADLLGVTRATVSAALGAFERQGLVKRGYRKLLVLSPEELALLALR